MDLSADGSTLYIADTGNHSIRAADLRGGSVVTLLCDSGERYADTYYDDGWLSAHDLLPDGYFEVLKEFEATCSWPVTAAGAGP